MAESGLLIEVRWEWDGTETMAAAALGAVAVVVENATTLAVNGEVWIGESGPHTISAINEDTSTITFGPGLSVAAEEGEPVVPDIGGGPAQVWVAEVVLVDSETPIEVPLTIKDLAVMPEGVYDPPKAVIISDDYQSVVDLPGSLPVINGINIMPGTLPPADTSDGLVPAASPPMTLIPLYATIMASWPPQANADLVGYEVWLSAPDVPAAQIGLVYGTSFQIMAEPSGLALRRNVVYTSWVRAFDEDGPADNVGVSASASVSVILPADIQQAILDDIAQAQTDATAAQTAAGSAQTAAANAKTAADNAAAAALAAQGTANSKGKLIVQVSAPTGANAVPENLWIDISGTPPKNTPMRYNTSTSAWEVITDVVAVNAASQALTAFNNAATAQARADLAFNNAAAAATAAGNAQTSANGKNTIWYLPDAPAGTGHKINDVWYDDNDGFTPYQWSGTAWVVKPWGHQSIATLDVGKATIGFLAGARIAANTINVSHLAVGDFTNLWPDPYFLLRVEGQPPVLTARMNNATVATTPVPPAGGNVAILNGRDHIALDSVAAKAGDEFLIEFTYKYVAGTAPIIGGLWQRKADGTNTTSVLPYANGKRDHLDPAVPALDLGNGWFRQRLISQVNPLATDAALVGLTIQIDQAGVSGTVVAVSDISWRRRNKGTLIVDGAISAKQVGADIIVANDVYSTTGYIGTLKADQITSGLLDATLGILQGLEVGPFIRINPKDGIVITLNEGEIRFPADGSPAVITAGINAKWLTIEDNLSIRGSGAIQGELSLANGITKPAVAPSISSKYDDVPIEAFGGTNATSDIYGPMIEWNSTQFLSALNFVGQAGLRFINKTATWTWGLDLNTDSWGKGFFVTGMCKIGSAIYVMGQDNNRPEPGSYYGAFYIWKINVDSATGVSTKAAGELKVAGPTTFMGYEPVLVEIGGLPSMVWHPASKYITVRRYNLALTAQFGTDRQLVLTSARYPLSDAHFGPHGASGANRLYVASNGLASVYAFSVDIVPSATNDPAFTRVTAEEFPRANNAIIKGLSFDTAAENGIAGNRFYSFSGTNVMSGYGRNIVQETTRVSYAWYDGTGVTHKTEASPEPATFYRQPRTVLNIEAPAAPDLNNNDAANVDKANQIIIYAAAFAPPQQQAILPIGTRTLTLRNTPAIGGGISSSSNEFATAGVTPGVLQSTAPAYDSGRMIVFSGAGSWRAGALSGDIAGKVTAAGDRITGFVPVGAIVPFAGTTVPPGWLLCNGSSYSSATYPALFSVMGTTALPDFSGRVPRGATPLTTGGADTVTMPEHGHYSGTYATSVEPTHSHGAGAITLAKVSRGTGTATPQVLSDISGSTGLGGNHSHTVTGNSGAVVSNPAIPNVPAYVGVNYIIRAI